jgi:tRNA-uridine 2-sulfurtransferase
MPLGVRREIMTTTKAIALLSGGLDSTLAVNLMMQQGIEVIALNFLTPFCRCSKKGCGSEAVKVTEKLGLELRVRYLGEEYLAIVRDPAHGYGKNMNPCVDCRILIFSKARKVMEEEGASFVFTGEVLGERPMSQRRDSMRIIEKESGLVGRLLRPLSAQRFPPILAEEEGLVDRSKLLAITGRSRKPQMRLAEEMGIDEYPCPAGGCLLTDPVYAKKVRDLVERGELTMDNVTLLRIGRHFRLKDSAKLIVGRDQNENKRLESLAREGDVVLSTFPLPGPVALLRKGDNGSIELSAMICAAHSDARNETEVPVSWRKAPDSGSGVVRVSPLSANVLEHYRIC